MQERELVSIIEGEVSRAIGHWDGQLATEREKELNYYNGKPFGNEVEGESQVMSLDVADTIEGILPSILRTFTASDDAVRFEPTGPEDEAEADQQTEVCNYVFYRQNNGFLTLYEWFKDALLQKNGIVKYWWEEKKQVNKETYEGLTEGQYLMLKQNPDIEFVEEKFYDDPQSLAQKEQIKQQIQTQAPPQNQAQALQQLEAQKVPQLYDCVLKITKDVSQIRIEAVPPEEFGISAKHNCVSIQQAPFCYHRTRKTISSLREEGCPEEVISKLSVETGYSETSPEALARDRFMMDQTYRDTSTSDPTTKEVWVTECFIRVDYDGDDIGELRHVIMPGREIWINEEAEHINFAAITPIIMPHRWIGKSMAELIMEVQFTKSVLLRQMLNNLYLTNNPRKAVLSSAGGIVQANLDDLLTSRPGGIVREYMPNAVRDIETPFVAGAAFPMMEYLDNVKETRTGVTRYTQGLDPDSQNKTAHGIAMIQSAGQQRLDLIARIFAETGVKDLFRGIVYMLSKYSSKAMTVKLRNKWVDVDPRGWKTQYNMTVNVGLGTGNRDVELAHLRAMHEAHMELMQSGKGYMVSEENVYNLYKKTSQAMGFKHPEIFITDPRTIPPEAKQPPPDPKMLQIQADQKTDQAKLQFAQWKETIGAKLGEMVENIRAQASIEVAKMDNATKERIAQMQGNHQAQLELFKGNQNMNSEFERWKAELDNATKIVVAQISAKASLDQAALQAAESAADRNVADSTGQVKNIEKTLGGVQTTLKDQSKAVSDALLNITKLLASQTEAAKKEKAQPAKPAKLSIENIQLGPDGIVKGATIRKH